MRPVLHRTVGKCAPCIYTTLLACLLVPDLAFGADLFVSGNISALKRYDAASGAFVATTGCSGNPVTGLATAPDGTIYVGQGDTLQIIRCDPATGAVLNVFASTAGRPEGMTVGPDGHLYVTIPSLRRVDRFSGFNGNFLGTFVTAEINDAPRDIKFGPDGNIYLLYSVEIRKYDWGNGAPLGPFAGAGVLNGAAGMLFAPDGKLYVTSWTPSRVSRFDATTGAFVDHFITGLSLPNGIVRGADGHLLIASEGTHDVRRFNSTTGAFMGVFAAPGNGLNQPTFLLLHDGLPDGDQPPAAGSFTIAEFNPATNRRFSIAGFANHSLRPGQTFRATRDGKLDTIRVMLRRNGDVVPSSVVIELRPVDPGTGVPLADALASSAVSPVGLDSYARYYTASFASSDVVLKAGKTYAVTLRTSPSGGVFAVGDNPVAASAYADGAYYKTDNFGATWSLVTGGNYDLAFRVTARPTLITSSNQSFGAGKLTLDLATGLEWLDLDLTKGRSPTEILTNFGGYIGAGFRFATAAEVQELFEHGALTTFNAFTSSPAEVAAAQALVDLLGQTASGGGFATTGGFALHPTIAGKYTQVTIEIVADTGICSPGSTPCTRALPANGSFDPAQVTSYVGALLVRETRTPDQSFTPTNFIGADINANGYQVGGGQSLAQTFTVGQTGFLDRISVEISGFGGGTEPILVEIRSTSGGMPSATAPLATATIPRALIPPSATHVALNLASPPAVSAGQVLALVLSSAEMIGSYSWRGAATSTNPPPPLYLRGAGYFSSAASPNWNAVGTVDYGFRTFISAAAADATPPVLSLPANITASATGPTGAVVLFNVSATDDTDPNPTVSCSPASGSTFPLGPTTVSCVATDVSGNSTQGSFSVNVVDNVAPVISGNPGTIIREAAGPSGAVATWTALTATDAVSGSVPVTCSPASGATFPLGPTTVNCSATDGRGNSASESFTVRVIDTTAPVLSGGSGNLTVQANQPAGAAVFYALPTAVDLVTSPVIPSCSPARGSVFPITTTMVSCTAVDAAGNVSAPKTFTVTVQDTNAPSLSNLTPGREARIMATPVIAQVSAFDATGVTSVTINGITASRVSGTPQNGLWRATGSVTLPAANLTLIAVARDVYGNTRTLSHVIDNDGIYPTIDRNRAGTADQSNFYSHEFKSANTDGLIYSRGGTSRIVRVQPVGSGVYSYVHGPGSAQAILNICGAPTRYVYMDTDEAVEMYCLSPTVPGSSSTLSAYISRTTPSGTVDIIKQATNQRFATYEQCGYYSSWFGGSGYRCYNYQAPIYATYWYLIRARQGVWISTGSPVTYDGYSQKDPPPDELPEGEPIPEPSQPVDLPNAPQLEVLILRALDDGTAGEMGTVDLENAAVVGSFVLDKTESAEIEVTGGATPDSEQIVLNALHGSVPVTIGGETRTATPGQPATLASDNAAPVLGTRADVEAYAETTAGVAVNFALPSASDNAGAPTVTASPASGSIFPIGETVVTVTATDAAGNFNTSTFKVTVRLKLNQAITFAPLSDKAFGDPSFALEASSSSNLPVSFTATGSCTVANGVVTLVAANACTLTAAQAGNYQYFAAQSVSQTFYVRHTWSGLLQPVNADGSSVFKLGSTVPVKFTLTGGSAPVTNLGARIYVSKVASGIVGTEIEATATTGPDAGNTFRFSETGNYIFNWGTKGLSEGTWQIRIDLLDGDTSRTVLVSLRK